MKILRNGWKTKASMRTVYRRLITPKFMISGLTIRPKDGFDFLEKEMQNAEPSCGYSVLVQVLAKTNHNVVITVNFDSMVEDAYVYVHG